MSIVLFSLVQPKGIADSKRRGRRGGGGQQQGADVDDRRCLSPSTGAQKKTASHFPNQRKVYLLFLLSMSGIFFKKFNENIILTNKFQKGTRKKKFK